MPSAGSTNKAGLGHHLVAALVAAEQRGRQFLGYRARAHDAETFVAEKVAARVVGGEAARHLGKLRLAAQKSV